MPEGLGGHAWAYDMAPAMSGIIADDNARTLALSVVASIVMGRIIDGWPVVTALSVAGFRRERSGNTWLVYNDVDYVPYVRSGLADRLASGAVEGARSAARESVKKTNAARGAGVTGDFGRASRAARRAAANAAAPSAAALAGAATFRSAVEIVTPLRPVVPPSIFNALLGLLRRRLWATAVAQLVRLDHRREARRLERLTRGN